MAGRVLNWRRESLRPGTAILLILVSAAAAWAGDAIRLGRGPQEPLAHWAVASHMRAATSTMRRTIDEVAELRRELGVALDPANDPNGTGLIGVEYSRITTTIGHLESKRTSTNPQFAGLIVRLLDEAGVAAGDAVAIGGSGSFPALILASLIAVEELGAHPVLISSMGASAWGANVPEFTWGDIEAGLHRRGAIDTRSVAVSMGGDRDTGFSMEADSLDLLERALARTGLPRIEERDLATNVAERMRRFSEGAGGRPVAAFVNVGGNWAHIGEGTWSLSLDPGLNTGFPDRANPLSADDHGLMYAYLARGVPVIHLLNIRELAFQNGLPIDPVPLPEGIGFLAVEPRARSRWWPLIALVLVGHVATVVVVLHRDRANRRFRREY